MAKTKYITPASKVQQILTGTAMTREEVADKLGSLGYSKSTIQSQIFNLNHWGGCIVENGTYRSNPDFVKPEPKAIKTKKTSGGSKKASRGAVRAVPKPSKKAKATA